MLKQQSLYGLNKEVKKTNTSTSDPTVDDDISKGYEVGSIWINTSTPAFYYCKDNTDGAAVWEQAGSASGTLDKKLTQAPVYYSDSTVKQLKYEYLKNSALYYEQRFEYTSGKVTKEEVNDDANGTWLQITYTYDGDGLMELPTYSVITAWTIIV